MIQFMKSIIKPKSFETNELHSWYFPPDNASSAPRSAIRIICLYFIISGTFRVQSDINYHAQYHTRKNIDQLDTIGPSQPLYIRSFMGGEHFCMLCEFSSFAYETSGMEKFRQWVLKAFFSHRTRWMYLPFVCLIISVYKRRRSKRFLRFSGDCNNLNGPNGVNYHADNYSLIFLYIKWSLVCEIHLNKPLKKYRASGPEVSSIVYTDSISEYYLLIFIISNRISV